MLARYWMPFPTPETADRMNITVSTAIADHAIRCLKEHADKHKDEPFFQYLCFTSPHFPLHAPAEDIARYKDRYIGGWEKIRSERYDRAKKLGISETEAPIVREAFALFLKYRQAAIVARLLNDRSMLPRGATNNPAKQGLRWTKDSISRLLRNPLYAGQMMYGKELHPGQHPRHIDEATHHQVMLSLAGKRRELRYTGVNHDYVLRGLVRCGRCGAAMSPASTKKGKTVHRYYRCCTRDKEGRQVCGARQLPAGALEEFVVERIALATADGSLVAAVERQMRERTDARRKANEELRAMTSSSLTLPSRSFTRFLAK